MNLTHSTLSPWAPLAFPLQISAGCERREKMLVFEFRMEDPESRLLDIGAEGKWSTWPRGDDLWRTTCCEAFWGTPGQPGYFELNLSPHQKRWNLYRFDEYRKPQPPCRDESFSIAAIEAGHDFLRCQLLSESVLRPVEMSLTVVAKHAAGVAYFALRHAGSKADFHLRSSFVLEV